MSIFTYHLVEIPFLLAIKGLFLNPISKNTKGLIHSEYMTSMTLGSSVLSPSRFLLKQVVVFAQWENEKSIDTYLEKEKFGKILAAGWHTRLYLVKKWGKFSKFKIPEQKAKLESALSPIVSITIARIKPIEAPRFIYWGKPVEKLVRDHPGSNFSLASIRFPNTVSTFSIWKTEKELINMVYGNRSIPKSNPHTNAMNERERRKFHFEFTTLRFKPIAEFGKWKGQKNIIPKFNKIS